MLSIDNHPLLNLRAFVTEFPAPLGKHVLKLPKGGTTNFSNCTMLRSSARWRNEAANLPDHLALDIVARHHVVDVFERLEPRVRRHVDSHYRWPEKRPPRSWFPSVLSSP